MEDTVDGTQQGGPGLVVEHYDYTGGGERRAAAELTLHTPGKQRKSKTLFVIKKEKLSILSALCLSSHVGCLCLHRCPSRTIHKAHPLANIHT